MRLGRGLRRTAVDVGSDDRRAFLGEELAATRPMPLPAPVTIATLPSRRPVTRRDIIGERSPQGCRRRPAGILDAAYRVILAG